MNVDADIPAARVARGPRVSLVWLLPLTAALVGAWLVYDALAARGPEITIAFKTGDGIEADRTVLRYKAVAIGKVTSIRIAPDLRHIIATARIDRAFADRLVEGTRFWVVRPRVGASGVSGLDTLVSGAYIEIDPGEGAPQRAFVGLESPPIVAADVPGHRYVLEAENLGSLQAGSGVFFRDIQVGEVLGFSLAEDGSRVTIHIFVREPYTLLVRDGTQFSNASGINVSVDANGIDLRTSSLQTLLVGGISFDLPIGNTDPPAAPGSTFWLYDSVDAVGDARYTEQVPYVLYFEDSVRGLSVGAPVEFKGIKLGSVSDIDLEVGAPGDSIRIAVAVMLQPQRLSSTASLGAEHPRGIIAGLIARGLRARLQTGSLLTGQMFVELGLYPEAPNVAVSVRDGVAEIPTMPSEFVEIKQSATELLDKLRRLPLDEIGAHASGSLAQLERLLASSQITDVLASADTTFAELATLATHLDEQLTPIAARIESALAAVDADSALHARLARTLDEVAAAARALRTVAGTVDRQPEALIWGRKSPADSEDGDDE